MKRQHGIGRVIGALLKAEIAAKQVRSINCQMGITKLPPAKELANPELDSTPINAELIEQLAGGDFLDNQRNVVLIGGNVRCRLTTPHRRTASTRPREPGPSHSVSR